MVAFSGTLVTLRAVPGRPEVSHPATFVAGIRPFAETGIDLAGGLASYGGAFARTGNPAMTSASSTLLRTARNALCALSIASAPLLAGHAPVFAKSADGLSYVFYADGSGSSMGSGGTDDWRRAQALRAGNSPFLYVRDGGNAYVIRDAATLARVKAIMAPQQELGRRQGALGAQQGELGRRQGALGRQQGELGRQMADARARDPAADCTAYKA